MEGLVVVGVVVLSILLCAAQVASLQVAANTMRPQPRLGLGQALVVWFVGALLVGVVQCAVGVAAQGSPSVAGLLSLGAGFVTYGVVLSTVAGMEILSAFGAILLWWLLQAVVGAVLAGSIFAAAYVLGG